MIKKKWHRYLLKFFVLGFSISLTLLILELFLRVADRPFVPSNLYCQYDAKLGWTKIPNRTNYFKTVGYTSSETINSMGFRGREYSLTKPAGTRRVVILGDSFAESYTVNEDQLFSNLLEKKLSQTYPTEVINTGLGGYSTDQELIVFEDTAQHFSPDLTILLFCENDVILNITGQALCGYTKPYYEWVDDHLQLMNVPVPLSGPTSSQGIKRWMQLHSVLYKRMRAAIENMPAINHLMVSVGVKHAHATQAFEQTSVNEYNGKNVLDIYRGWKNELDDDYQQAWHMTEVLLNTLKTKTTAIGSEFLIFYVTLEEGTKKSAWQATKTRYQLNDTHWNVHNSARKLGDICRKLGIAYIDPTETFQKKESQVNKLGQTLYYPDDGHWTPAGNQLVCEILENYITSQKLLLPTDPY